MADGNDDLVLEQLQLPNCKNIGTKPPTNRIKQPDGTILIEKIPPMPCHKKMVDPSGHVLRVPLASGYMIRGLGAHNPYGVQTLARLLREGWLPYDECPVAKGYLPAARGDKACAGKDGNGKFSRDECCHHVQTAIDARYKVYSKDQEQFASQMATNQERMIKLLEQQSAAMLRNGTEKGDGKQ